MKILQVYPYFYPACSYGGVTRVCYDISKALSKNHHNVVVYTTDALDKNQRYTPESDPVIHQGIKIYYFKNISNFLTYKYKIPLPLLMPFIIKNQIKNFDIIHLHGHRHFLSLITYFFAKKNNIPYIVQVHGDLPYYGKENFKKIYDYMWGNKILKNASCLIAVTKTEKKQYLDKGISEDKIEIIHNGIDPSDHKALPERGIFRKKIGITPDEKLILYLGRLHKRKGIDFLINSFSLLDRNIKVKLVIAGYDDGFLDFILRQIKKLDIEDSVIYAGSLNETEKYQALVDADLLVYPGIFEIFGLVPFEAIICGTPVIVTDDCGCGEVIEEARCGYLVKYGDVEGLKDKMLFLINNDSIFKESIINGQTFIQNKLIWSIIVGNIEKMYHEILVKSTKNINKS